MSYKSLENIIREIAIQELSEASLGNHKGLVALASGKSGDEKSTMTRAADMIKKGQIKDLNMFMKAMDKSTHKAIMPYIDKKHYKALHEDSLDEKKLTPAELKKREEIAKAIERDNPDMEMGKKMAIATAQAKKVTEATVNTADIEKNKHISYNDKDKLSKVADMMRKEKEAQAKKVKEDTEIVEVMSASDKQTAHAVHKALQNDDMPGSGYGSKIKHAHKQLRQKYGSDWRKKAGITEDTEIVENGHEDVMSAKNQVKIAMAALQKMNGELNKLGDEDDLPTWWTNKVAIAVDKLDGMADYLGTQVEEVELEEAENDPSAGYTHTHEPTKNGGYRAVLKNKEGKISYMGGTTYKTKSAAHGEAKAYHNRYWGTPGMKTNEKGAENAVAAYRSKNKHHIKEEVDQVNEYITSKQIKMAKGIANDPRHKGGDMTGASQKMEKIKKGLSNHPAVKKALKQANEAVGTAAKYADKKGVLGGKYSHHDRARDMKSDKFAKWRDKQQAKRDAAHKAQDPSMAKRGYAQNVVDRDKAQKKAEKKGLGQQSISWQQGNSVKRGKLPEAFGREALQKKYEKITKDKTGETLKQRQDWYKKNIEDTKKRMQQNNESNIVEVRGGADEPDKHIIMQLRKAQDVDGNHDITFRGGHKAKVAKKHIDKILKAHDHPSTKPVAKRMMRVAISKSPKHLSAFADRLKEDYDETGREKIHTKKADFGLKKVRLPDGKLVYRKVKKEVDIEK